MSKLITVFLLVISTTCYAQDYEKALNKYLSSELGKLAIPNVEISVVNRNGIMFTRSIGAKTKKTNLFYLGSVSKSLTALGVLKLVEGGKLKFEDKLSEIIPEMSYNEYAREITVRHLLNHTSGIPKKHGFNYLPGLHELAETKYPISVMQSPGESHEYSNLNYSLLGLIIERTSGVSFGEFMAIVVFNPLQMNNSKTYSQNQSTGNIIDQYQYWGPFPIKSKQTDYSATSIPAGFIQSNIWDMSNYLTMMLGNGEYKKEKFIDSRLITEMTRPWDNTDYGYCMGWKKGMYNNKVIFQHLGSTPTSYSAIFIIPEENIGFTILTNSNSLSYTENIAEGILDILTKGEKFEVSGTEFYLRIGILLAISTIIISLTLKIIKLLKSKNRIEPRKILTSLSINILLLISFVFFFPRIANVPLLSLFKLQPDIGTLIILILVSPLLINLLKWIHSYYLKM